MAAALADHMREFTRAAFGEPAQRIPPTATLTMELPPWLSAA